MAKIAGAGNGGALAPGSNGATGAPSARPRGSGRNAVLVAAGIALSRGIGLVRERIFSHYFGLSDAGDAFKAAFRIPNLLQNLFGEGVLSASFIPVYSAELAGGDREEADRVAGAVLALLSLAVAFIVLAGVLVTQPYKEMRRIIQSGAIGTVVQVLAQKCYPWHARRPADIRGDAAPGLSLRRLVVHLVGLSYSVAHARSGLPRARSLLSSVPGATAAMRRGAHGWSLPAGPAEKD